MSGDSYQATLDADAQEQKEQQAAQAHLQQAQIMHQALDDRALRLRAIEWAAVHSSDAKTIVGEAAIILAFLKGDAP